MTAALEAAARLAEKLPGRTHRICDDDVVYSPTIGRAVVVAGVRYKSANQARIALHVNIAKVHEMIDSGEASYA
jgi:hypothetical protein